MLRSGFNDLQGMQEAEPITTDVSAEESIPDDEEPLPTCQKGVLDFNINANQVMVNSDITFDDLMFQLFYRDLLKDEIKEQANQ